MKKYFIQYSMEDYIAIYILGKKLRDRGAELKHTVFENAHSTVTLKLEQLGCELMSIGRGDL